MSASTDSRFSFNFKVLSDTFGEVKFRQQHPGYEDDDADFDMDPQTRQNTAANLDTNIIQDVMDDLDDATTLKTGTTNVADVYNVDNVNSPAAPNPLPWTTGGAGGTGNIPSPPPPPPPPPPIGGGVGGGGWGGGGGVGGVSNPGLVTGGAESSSSHSSVSELTAAQERGLRTSFRNQTGLQANAKEADETPVKMADVHVRGVSGDIDIDTPASTASSTARFFLNGGGKSRDFNVGNLQQNYGATTREKIRMEYSGRHDTGATAPAPKLSQSNNVTIITGDDYTPGDYRLFQPKEKKTHCCPKVTMFLVTLVLIVGGVVAAVLLLKEDYPDKQVGDIIKDPEEEKQKDICKKIDVKLRDVIQVSCALRGNSRRQFILPEKLRIVPPSYVNEGEPLLLGLDPQIPSGQWKASFDQTRQEITIMGPPALCSSTGTYDLEFLDGRDLAIYNSSIKINVLSEVLKVNVSLSQSVEDNSTDFTVACQTNSGCEQSFVDFFAEINKEEQYLRGVNFTCIIDYNDYDGYSVSCMGVIPDYLMSQFGRITCRPRSTLLDDLTEEELEDLEEILELPECDISKHCDFKCKDTGDYYTVNSGRCDIFHRCHQKQVYTSYCAPGTFFDPSECACRHTRDLAWCQDNGAVKKNADASNVKCSTGAEDMKRKR